MPENIDNEVIVMSKEAYENITVEDAYELYASYRTEQDLTDIFALLDNKVWHVDDYEHYYAEGTDKYLAAKEIADKWFELFYTLKKSIFTILRSEDIAIPSTEQLTVFKPFMK